MVGFPNKPTGFPTKNWSSSWGVKWEYHHLRNQPLYGHDPGWKSKPPRDPWGFLARWWFFKYMFGFSLPNPGEFHDPICRVAHIFQMGSRVQPPTILGKLGASLLFLLLPYHPWDKDLYLPTWISWIFIMGCHVWEIYRLDIPWDPSW